MDDIIGFFFSKTVRRWLALTEDQRSEEFDRRKALLDEVSEMPQDTLDQKIARVDRYMTGLHEIERDIIPEGETK